MKIQIIGQLGANTGKTIGDVRMSRPKALIITMGFAFTESQLADSESIKAAVEAALILSRSSVNKCYVITGFREADDNTGDPNTGTLADGYEEVLNEALAKYVFRHTAGVAQTQSYEEFNGWDGAIYVIDDKNILWGVVTDTKGGRGFSCGSMYWSYPKFGGTGNINTGSGRVTFGSVDEFKKGNVFARKLNFSVASLTNMIDVDLSEVGAAAGYVFKLGVNTKYAGTSIYETYQDLLAVVGAWKATRMDTGADVPISAVAKNAVTKGWDVTLDNVAAIPAGTKVKIELKDPTALAALATPVKGIESSYVIVTKPA